MSILAKVIDLPDKLACISYRLRQVALPSQSAMEEPMSIKWTRHYVEEESFRLRRAINDQKHLLTHGYDSLVKPLMQQLESQPWWKLTTDAKLKNELQDAFNGRRLALNNDETLADLYRQLDEVQANCEHIWVHDVCIICAVARMPF